MKNALILHGTGSTSQDNWFPWLGKKLKLLGYDVWTPDLPRADKPNIERYNAYIKTNQNFTIGENTILIGHSSGAVAILGLLESLPEDTVVEACYLVGSFKDDLGWDALSELFLKPFDFDKIRQHARRWYFLHADNDPYCPLSHAEFLQSQIGGDLIVLPGQKHFSVETMGKMYWEFPYLYHLIAHDAMDAGEVVSIYTTMKSKGVRLFIDGGWGVDALLGKQTRPHGDLDVVIERKNLEAFDQYLRQKGYRDILRGDTSNYNYMLGDEDVKLVDIHVIELDEEGNGLYGKEKDGIMYPVESLSGKGKIAGQEVDCISPEWVVKFHTGYKLRESDRHDVTAICEKYGIDVPEEYRILDIYYNGPS